MIVLTKGSAMMETFNKWPTKAFSMSAARQELNEAEQAVGLFQRQLEFAQRQFDAAVRQRDRLRQVVSETCGV